MPTTKDTKIDRAYLLWAESLSFYLGLLESGPTDDPRQKRLRQSAWERLERRWQTFMDV